MKVITTERIPIKIWVENIEEGAMDQTKNLANLPFAFKHIAIMPDVHQGYGMPIGGVLATKGIIIPNAVGVDIGCGMCALKTSLTEIDIDTLKQVMGKIREVIPVGFNHHKKPQSVLLPDITENTPKIVCNQLESARHQIGTLGGGNHFIEIQKGSDNHIWIMIHSGSRNLGYKTADYYNKLAIKLNKKWYSEVPKSHELAFLPIESKEAKEYFCGMKYCVDFAYENRQLMLGRIGSIFIDITKCNFKEDKINIAHNYAEWENHFNQNVIVHRKGATRARKGEIGIIPGSQGTKSYIVKGLGNPESFMSCSHGAGRVMGRNEARKRLDIEEETKKLEDKGIIHSIRGPKDLDEAPGSYKNIQQVMKDQRDLVEILVELSPLGVIKG
jgi:tRNA-splicing ligase RtcB